MAVSGLWLPESKLSDSLDDEVLLTLAPLDVCAIAPATVITVVETERVAPPLLVGVGFEGVDVTDALDSGLGLRFLLLEDGDTGNLRMATGEAKTSL